ncbi:MAG: type I restriction endonuclease, partial [Chlorobium sp.]
MGEPGLTTIGNSERETQNRVLALFTNELDYRFLGDWKDREGNSNIEESLLTAYLLRNGYTPAQSTKAIHELRIEANNPNRTLYDNNRKVYSLLHYGVPVQAAAGEKSETIKLINTGHPELNDFAIAEEVT